MAVLLYWDWANGSLSGGTYTAATPDIPDAHTITFTGDESIAVDNDSPWSGQTCLFMPDSTATYGQSTVSSSTAPATQGRMLVEFQNPNDGYGRTIFDMRAATYYEGLLQISSDASLNLKVELMWDGASVTVNLGSFPLNTATAIEVIWDTNNGTASERLKARTWTKGGSPPSFTSTGDSSSAGTQDQYTGITIGNNGTAYYVEMGKLIISDDIAEDLSSWAPTGGGASLMGQACL